MKILIITILLCLTYFGWLKLYKDENFWGGEREALSDWLASKDLPLLSELLGCPYCCAFWTNAIIFGIPVFLCNIYAGFAVIAITAVMTLELKKEDAEWN